MSCLAHYLSAAVVVDAADIAVAAVAEAVVTGDSQHCNCATYSFLQVAA